MIKTHDPTKKHVVIALKDAPASTENRDRIRERGLKEG